MQKGPGGYRYSPTDLVEFFDSTFASWISRFALGFLERTQPDLLAVSWRSSSSVVRLSCCPFACRYNQNASPPIKMNGSSESKTPVAKKAMRFSGLATKQTEQANRGRGRITLTRQESVSSTVRM